MGGSSSKLVRTAAAGTKRKLPKSVTSTTLHQKSPIPPTQTPQSSTTSQSPSSNTTQNLHPTPGPKVQPSPASPSSQPSSTRSEFIDLDARDPTFSSNLRTIGPVQPFPTYSNTSTFEANPSQSTNRTTDLESNAGQQVFPSTSLNPALKAIRAREQVARRVEEEAEAMGRKGFQGRTLVDAGALGSIIRARETAGDSGLEERWGLKKGLLEEKLGKGGSVFGRVSS